MTETKPKRRWFRFSIRDLLWLTAVVALTVGWGMTLAENQRLRNITLPISIHDESIEKAMRPIVPAPRR